MKVFIGLIFAFLIYFILQRLYLKIWNKGLSAELYFSSDTAVEGDVCELSEIIVNRKFLPLPMLRISFYTHKNILPGNGENTVKSDKSYRADIFTMLSYQKITRNLSFICKKRGYYTIGDIQATASDPLMSLRLSQKFYSDTSILIYPKGADAERLSLPFSKIMGLVISEKFSYEDPFEFRTIRQYQTFDSMKSVNWKASAKTGELLVNANNYTIEQEAAILLCLDSETSMGDEDLREEAIQLASAFSELFTAQGIPISLYSNGCDMVTHEKAYASRGSGKAHVLTIREKLARIDLDLKAERFSHLFKEINKKTSYNAIPILISPSSDKRLSDEYFLSYPNKSVWVIAHRPDNPPNITSTDERLIIPWEVSY